MPAGEFDWNVTARALVVQGNLMRVAFTGEPAHLIFFSMIYGFDTDQIPLMKPKVKVKGFGDTIVEADLKCYRTLPEMDPSCLLISVALARVLTLQDGDNFTISELELGFNPKNINLDDLGKKDGKK